MPLEFRGMAGAGLAEGIAAGAVRLDGEEIGKMSLSVKRSIDRELVRLGCALGLYNIMSHIRYDREVGDRVGERGAEAAEDEIQNTTVTVTLTVSHFTGCQRSNSVNMYSASSGQTSNFSGLLTNYYFLVPSPLFNIAFFV